MDSVSEQVTLAARFVTFIRWLGLALQLLELQLLLFKLKLTLLQLKLRVTRIAPVLAD
jgi:hypothetical protein